MLHANRREFLRTLIKAAPTKDLAEKWGKGKIHRTRL
jgi:hypothetical protein